MFSFDRYKFNESQIILEQINSLKFLSIDIYIKQTHESNLFIL